MSNSPPPAGRFLAAERRAWEARCFGVTLTLGMGPGFNHTGMINKWHAGHQPITAIPSRVMA